MRSHHPREVGAYGGSSSGVKASVAKMVSHAILQYNVLAIDDTHNTWTNICVKMIIIRFIGPRDVKIKDPKETKSKGSNW